MVKVLRPGMRDVIERDLEVLFTLADLAQRYWSDARRLRPVEMVAEYEKTILDELDLMREAANAAHLKRNFAGSPLLYVPDVYWDLPPRRRDGDGAHPRRADQRHGDVARGERGHPKLAKNGVEIFFTQVFRHNFFHADMHPGNIFVLIDDPANPRYAAIDFGIVGTLDPRDQHYLAENFLAVVRSRLPAQSPCCTSSPAGCRQARASTRWRARSARCASRSSTSRSRTSRSARCWCGCSRSRGGSTWRSSRS